MVIIIPENCHVRLNRFVYLFEKFDSWFFVYFKAGWRTETKTVQYMFSAAVYDTAVNAIAF